MDTRDFYFIAEMRFVLSSSHFKTAVDVLLESKERKYHQAQILFDLQTINNNFFFLEQMNRNLGINYIQRRQQNISAQRTMQWFIKTGCQMSSLK